MIAAKDGRALIVKYWALTQADAVRERHMVTFDCRTALTAAALAVLAVGCGAGGGDGATTLAGGYERTDVQFWLRYRTSQTGQPDSTVTFQVVGSSADGFTRRSYTGAFTSYLDSTFALDGDGLSVLSGGAYTAAGATTSTVVYDPPLLMLPGNRSPGAFISRTTTTTTTTPGGVGTSTSTRDATVDGPESVTVPAGTFQALKVSMLITASDASAPGSSYVAWWAPGVGRVKMVSTTLGATPTVFTTELEATGKGPLPIATPDGSYKVTEIRCNGLPAPSPLASLIAGGWSLAVSVAGAVQSTAWNDGSCTLTQPGAAGYPAIGNVTITPSGPFACAPSAAACASLSDALFGQQVCGQTDVAPKRYAFTSSAAPVGGFMTLTRLGGAECAAAGATDPVQYTLLRLP